MITFLNKSHNPYYNQAFEEYIFEHFKNDDVFYLWRNTPVVVVGSYQNICREVSLTMLRNLGIPVIRRISGGGTVYHDMGNINYTYITSKDNAPDYDASLSLMIKALNSMGIKAYKNKTCDIAIEQGKISGSAQRISHNRVLHHGTLLYKSDLKVLDNITTAHKNDAFVSKGTVSDISGVSNISSYMPRAMSIEDFEQELLSTILGENFIYTELAKDDYKSIEDLSLTKYKSWEWTWGKTPTFTYSKDSVYRNKPIHVEYKARKGILSDVLIMSEYIDTDEVASLINGKKLSTTVFDSLSELVEEQYWEDFLNILL